MALKYLQASNAILDSPLYAKHHMLVGVAPIATASPPVQGVR